MDPSGRLDQRKILGPFDETFMTGSARSARQSIALVDCFTVQVLLKPWEATHRDSSNSHESTSETASEPRDAPLPSQATPLLVEPRAMGAASTES